MIQEGRLAGDAFFWSGDSFHFKRAFRSKIMGIVDMTKSDVGDRQITP
jgi:hypothetical protein